MTRVWRATAVAAVLAGGLGVASPARGQRYFGQNQVEYHHLNWRVLETEHFKIYYYPEERVPVQDAARMAERSYFRLSRLLGHQFREKKPILLFASIEDFNQNNVTGELPEGVGGVTDASRQRMLVPFTGDYRSFEHVLTHEMVHQFQYDVYSQGKAGDNLQTLEQVNPPGWFMEGMAEYLSLGPNHPLTTMWMRDAVSNGDFPTIDQLTRYPDRYFVYRYGEDLWRYIGERWGDAAIGEILESSASVGIERAFQRELGLTLTQLSDQWREATRAEYLPQLATRQRVKDFAQPMLTPERSNGQMFLAPALSPNARHVAFFAVGNYHKGQIFTDLWLGNALTGKRIRRIAASTTNPKFEELRILYTQGSFSPDGGQFAFTAQTGGRDVLSIADIRAGGVKQLKNIPLDGVWSPSWSPDGKQLAITGLHNAMTDLYLVDANGRNLRPLTQDRYGELMPAWSPDGTRIAFATDRATTNLADLAVGKMQIAIYDLRDSSITVLPNQVGQNINPVWSPDGHTIAYISDRNGTQNVYLHNFSTGVDQQLTNVQGGVSGWTDYSPALTWARDADRLAFTYYDKNNFTVWSLDHPERYAHAIPPAPAAVATITPGVPSATPQAAGTPVHDSTPGGVAGTSTYIGSAGARASAAIPAAEATDSTNVSSVATMLANPTAGLPDPASFKEYPYHVRFEPDYIAGSSVGVSTSPGYGTYAGGQTTLVFSDLTGDHQLAVGAGVYGRLTDASFVLGYGDFSHRLQYSTSISQDIAYYYLGAEQLQDPTTNPNGVGVIRYVYQRYAFRTATISGAYPLNRFTRFELGLQGTSIGRSARFLDYTVDVFGNLYGVRDRNGPSASTLSFVSPVLAYVSDNTLATPLTSVSGRRMRFSVSPSIGSIRWTNYLADYRRYDPVIFNTLTFATRFFFDASVGRDERYFPIYIGTPDFVRGYDQSSFYGGYNCQSFLGTASAYGNSCATTQLLGTRVAVFNEELRFPIIRRFDLGALPIGLPPVDGAIFYDAGLAWSKGQRTYLTKPANFDENTQRYVLRSWGASIRANLFNFLILRWDYAKPLDRPLNKKAFWTFSIGPTF